MDVRCKIKSIVVDRAINQAEIARRAEIDPAALCLVLKCKRTLEANALLRICKALDMTAEEVMNYTPKTEK